MAVKPGPSNKRREQNYSYEMRFIYQTAGYIKWGHERNEDILHEFKIESMLNTYNSIRITGENVN